MLRILQTLGHRFFWKSEEVRFVPFLPFFALQNLLIGVAFLLGYLIPGISKLTLFVTLTAFFPSPFNATIWGLLLVLIFVGHCFEMYFRGRGIGPLVAMSGFILWCYGLGVYLSQAVLIGTLGIVLPQLFFWAWYYIEAKKYHRDSKLGVVLPVR